MLEEATTSSMTTRTTSSTCPAGDRLSSPRHPALQDAARTSPLDRRQTSPPKIRAPITEKTRRRNHPRLTTTPRPKGVITEDARMQPHRRPPRNHGSSSRPRSQAPLESPHLHHLSPRHHLLTPIFHLPTPNPHPPPSATCLNLPNLELRVGTPRFCPHSPRVPRLATTPNAGTTSPLPRRAPSPR